MRGFGLQWNAEAVEVSSAFETYYTRCRMPPVVGGLWESYSELDDGTTTAVFRKRQVDLYERHGLDARKEMDRPSYFLREDMNLPNFEYKLFTEEGRAVGALAGNNPHRSELSDGVEASVFFFRAVDVPVPVTTAFSSTRAIIHLRDSPSGFPMYLTDTGDAVEFSQTPREITLDVPVRAWWRELRRGRSTVACGGSHPPGWEG